MMRVRTSACSRGIGSAEKFEAKMAQCSESTKPRRAEAGVGARARYGGGRETIGHGLRLSETA